uniref:ABC transporter domain-containing protein n=1 Tax=Lutzomyia longipalpis TaxID=7200 RepID=A0A1B0CMJ5_LUTLO
MESSWNRGEKKQILKKLTGKFNSGEITAILGPSGAGKSSLLNVLTGFIKKGVEGNVMFTNGKNAVKLKSSRSYILQDDNLFPWYTVNETMMLACQLKVANVSSQSRQKMIDNILNTLHLLHTKNTRCKNLSGGQKKRLSIALELIDNPSVLFLDEPTTGLDSSSSTQCVRLLQNLAREGRTIICTIHQPSATIYNTFDHVYIMAEGQCVYQGSADNTVSYLSSLGLHCPQYHSPADYIIEVANGDYGNFTYSLAKAATDNRWRSSQLCIMDRALGSKDNRSSFISDSSNSSSSDNPSTTSITSSRHIERPSEWSRFGTLMNRCKLQCFRDWCVYQGSADNTVSYLSSLGLHCPQYHSPADYIIEVANGDYGNFTYSLAKAATDNRWRSSQLCIMDRALGSKDNRSSFISDSSNSSSSDNPSTTSITSSRHIERPSEWSRFGTLMNRCKLQCFRDWTVTHLKVLCHVLCAILIGLIYGDSGLNATKSINNVGFLIIGVVYLWYTTMMPGVLRFPSEIAILKKETFNGWYKLRTYYFATIAIMAPIHIMFAVLYSVIAFLITQQPLETMRLFKFVLIYAITTITADGFGIFLGTVVNPVNGTFFGAVGTCFLLVFSGFLVLFNHMPDVMRILSYFSFKRYSLEGLVLAIYDNNRSSLWCPETELYCHYRNPMYLINELGMTPKNFNFDLSMMIIQMCAIKTLTYFTLKRRMTN